MPQDSLLLLHTAKTPHALVFHLVASPFLVWFSGCGDKLRPISMRKHCNWNIYTSIKKILHDSICYQLPGRIIDIRYPALKLRSRFMTMVHSDHCKNIIIIIINCIDIMASVTKFSESNSTIYFFFGASLHAHILSCHQPPSKKRKKDQ